MSSSLSRSAGLVLALALSLGTSSSFAATTPKRKSARVTAITAIPVDATSTGPEDAPVTVVEFTDFQCPYCRHAVPTMHQLMAQYPGKIRWIVKQSPLAIHPSAPLAHEAALAAGAQGKFWEMHDLIFANQTHISEADLVGYAQVLKLDVPRFTSELRSHKYRPVIIRDRAEARGLGIVSTPTFFINGRTVVGNQPLETLSAVVSRQLGLNEPAAPVENAVTARVSGLNAGGPARGAESAPVTIVEFSDFECPFCRRSVPALEELLKSRPSKVRWVFKNYPLDFHKHSELAHKAAFAAAQQGKFWQMHDLLFNNQKALDRQDLVGYAGQLGLDLTRFTSDMESSRADAAIAADRAEGARVNVGGTPTMFVNGRPITGVRTLQELQQIVDGELRLAASPANANASVYKTTTVADTATLIEGDSTGPITLTWFSDVRSGLSVQTAQLLKTLSQQYEGKLRILYKNRPLENHPDATLAHRALMAAHAQGKFWPMYNLLASDKEVSREDVVNYAIQIGIDANAFSTALDSIEVDDVLRRDLDEARRRAVQGSPVVFINGKRVDGLQPAGVYTNIIEQELPLIR